MSMLYAGGKRTRAGYKSYISKHPDNQHCQRSSRLISLECSDPMYAQVERLLLKGWRHSDKASPEIRGVFKILSSDESLKAYTDYKSQVHAFNLLSRFKKGANEQLCFHGTRRVCALGEDRNQIFLCNSAECSVCCIIRSSYDVSKCGDVHSFKRFGNGIYTTSCSSKADDYSSVGRSSCRHPNRNLRILLLNRVVVGKPHSRRHNKIDLNRPPTGYHSVVGLPGVDLNYEETVVYRNDAIRPAYLVVYGTRAEPPASERTPETKQPKLFFMNPAKNPMKPTNRSYSTAHALLLTLFNTPLAP